eukprot:scaffold120723_cov20-Tisochrysis_lutea.AAC.1
MVSGVITVTVVSSNGGFISETMVSGHKQVISVTLVPGSAEAAAEEAAALKSLEELKYSHLRFKVRKSLQWKCCCCNCPAFAVQL